MEKDLIFHLKIAEASKNPVLKSLMMIITPDILTYFKENNICGGDRPVTAIAEHHEILKNIENGDGDAAEKAMKKHLEDILNHSLSQNGD